MTHQPTNDGPVCQSCACPVADHAHLCNNCADSLAHELRQVKEIMADLEITRSKQDVISDRHARVSGTRGTPLGFRPAAREAADLMHLTLAFWARTIAHSLGKTVRGGTTVGLAMWLGRHRETIRHHDGAADLLNQVRAAIGNARDVVDRPPERVYSGRCACGADLYARERAHQVACPACRNIYSVTERRTAMLTEIREHFATAAEIAAGIGELHGQQINRKTINKWSSRDRITVRGYSPEGYPLFRIGDVLDLAVSHNRRHTPPVIGVA